MGWTGPDPGNLGVNRLTHWLQQTFTGKLQRCNVNLADNDIDLSVGLACAPLWQRERKAVRPSVLCLGQATLQCLRCQNFLTWPPSQTN